MVRFRPLLIGISAAFAAWAAILALNAVVMPRLHSESRPSTGQRVSLLVPARDEEAHLLDLLPALAAQGADEVIVFDDGLNGVGLRDADALGVRVISSPRPAGWAGKNWACWELARAANGDVLVFTDADTCWQPGSLDAILAARSRLDADMLSVLPTLRGLGLSTRLVTPLLENVVLTMAPWPLLSWDQLGMGTTCGALMAITREAYFGCGGHRRIADRIQEDILLARGVQHSTIDGRRGRARLALSGGQLGIVSYRTYAESVRGFGKSLVAVHDGSRVATVANLFAFATTHTLPWLLPVSRWVWVLRAAGLADRTLTAMVAGRQGPADLAEGLLGQVSPIAVSPCVFFGLQGRITWKGRDYEQSATRPR